MLPDQSTVHIHVTTPYHHSINFIQKIYEFCFQLYQDLFLLSHVLKIRNWCYGAKHRIDGFYSNFPPFIATSLLKRRVYGCWFLQAWWLVLRQFPLKWKVLTCVTQHKLSSLGPKDWQWPDLFPPCNYELKIVLYKKFPDNWIQFANFSLNIWASSLSRLFVNIVIIYYHYNNGKSQQHVKCSLWASSGLYLPFSCITNT